MLARQGDRVTLQLLNAEQLRAQQLGIPMMAQPISCTRRISERFDDYDTLLEEDALGTAKRWPADQ
ncbi:hypothetical protein Q6D67_10175 [Haliea sp. E1-2-M8]|uniref:hypothetical protein n=1 Tax=Haliea sp. E1-2-M8 TaxID=3064706 RepID=UPI00272099AE|nr:hypothetical protein [Haliea sp. E1-2-M8]MDO8862069.1 hypothetical protein [Haliea sp. E1-2-M8]